MPRRAREKWTPSPRQLGSGVRLAAGAESNALLKKGRPIVGKQRWGGPLAGQHLFKKSMSIPKLCDSQFVVNTNYRISHGVSLPFQRVLWGNTKRFLYSLNFWLVFGTRSAEKDARRHKRDLRRKDWSRKTRCYMMTLLITFRLNKTRFKSKKSKRVHTQQNKRMPIWKCQ